MEQAHWIDWQQETCDTMQAGRFYFGHETCRQLLPSPPRACELAKRCRDRGIPVTLVTPFLTNCGFRTTLELITRLLAVVETLEVVCSDWGLLYYLASQKLGTPVIGRLLAAQATDPRIMRMLDGQSAVERPRVIRHLDGTACQLRRRCPSASLTGHYRGCWLDKPHVLSFRRPYCALG